MIVPIVGCILAGCLQDVPVIVSNNPIRSYLSAPRKEKIDRSKFSCYVNGEFYTSCPN